MVDGAVGAGAGSEPESSDSLRTFGAVVQALREHAGLSREEFADLVRFSKHTVASVELGRRMPDPALVERAEGVLGNTGALRRAAGHLARQPGLAAWFRSSMALPAGTVCRWPPRCPRTRGRRGAGCGPQGFRGRRGRLGREPPGRDGRPHAPDS